VSNWLPASRTTSSGSMLRLYAPKPQVADGTLNPPPIRRVNRAGRPDSGRSLLRVERDRSIRGTGTAAFGALPPPAAGLKPSWSVPSLR
jgi:hypothetical protein